MPLISFIEKAEFCLGLIKLRIVFFNSLTDSVFQIFSLNLAVCRIQKTR